MAPLYQGEDSDPRNEDEADQRRGRHDESTTASAFRIVDGPFSAITIPPGRDRVRKHIVIDLVTSARAVLGARSDDSLRGKSAQYVCSVLFFNLGVTGEVPCPVRDLRTRRSNEEVVHRCGGILLPLREIRHRMVEMVFDDLRRTTELRQCLSAKKLGAAIGL